MKEAIIGWLKVNVGILVCYFVFDLTRLYITGEVDPFAVQVGLVVGKVLAVFLWYILPFILLKKFITKFTKKAA